MPISLRYRMWIATLLPFLAVLFAGSLWARSHLLAQTGLRYPITGVIFGLTFPLSARLRGHKLFHVRWPRLVVAAILIAAGLMTHHFDTFYTWEQAWALPPLGIWGGYLVSHAWVAGRAASSRIDCKAELLIHSVVATSLFVVVFGMVQMDTSGCPEPLAACSIIEQPSGWILPLLILLLSFFPFDSPVREWVFQRLPHFIAALISFSAGLLLMIAYRSMALNLSFFPSSLLSERGWDTASLETFFFGVLCLAGDRLRPLLYAMKDRFFIRQP